MEQDAKVPKNGQANGTAKVDPRANNTALWNRVKDVDPRFTKEVSMGRRRFTAIAGQYKKWRATQEWGPMGNAWGMRDCHYEYIRQPEAKGNLVIERIVEVVFSGTFYYPGGEIEISTDIQYHPGSDYRKKLRTDALTKALSELGFGATVFLEGKDPDFSDNKYVSAEPKDSPRDSRQKPVLNKAMESKLLERINEADTREAAKAIANQAAAHFAMTQDQKSVINTRISKKSV